MPVIDTTSLCRVGKPHRDIRPDRGLLCYLMVPFPGSSAPSSSDHHTVRVSRGAHVNLCLVVRHRKFNSTPLSFILAFSHLCPFRHFSVKDPHSETAKTLTSFLYLVVALDTSGICAAYSSLLPPRHTIAHARETFCKAEPHL